MKTKIFLAPAKETKWETPQWLFDKLNSIFHFDTDVCASECNAKCSAYYTEAENGLLQSWGFVNWMNPPYGRGIDAWLRKAWFESLENKTTIALVPASTSTGWWHDYAERDDVGYVFVKGKLKFGGSKNGAPFHSALLFFWAKNTSLRDRVELLDKVIRAVNWS